jgi:GH25 family lysozyme M1 (1,4-beta-N-acetylmuramidase)
VPLYGIDVSEFQLRPDYAKVAASGISFVIARVGYGTSHPDASYLSFNKAAIPAHGLLPGAYHFLVAGQDAATQADVFCAAADPNALHALDVETTGHADVPGFMARYRTHYPEKPLAIYTGRDLWKNATGGINGALYGPLWVAGYVPNTYVGALGSVQQEWPSVGKNSGGLPFSGWTSEVMMQFTDHATVPGINGGVDGDYFYGTADDFRSLITGANMPLSQADIDAVSQETFNKVFNYVIPGLEHADGPGQPVNVQTLLSRLYSEEIMEVTTGVRVDSSSVSAAVTAAVTAYFGGHPGAAGIDVAAVAKAAADEVGKRLSSGA